MKVMPMTKNDCHFGNLRQAIGTLAPGMEDAATLLQRSGARIESIASLGAASPPGFWYDEAEDEFVLLVAGAAELSFADGSSRRLMPGDWVLLPAHCRHRVAWTDPNQETLWLAVHLPPG